MTPTLCALVMPADRAFAAMGLLNPPSRFVLNAHDRAIFHDAAREVMDADDLLPVNCPALSVVMRLVLRHGTEEWYTRDASRYPEISLIAPISWGAHWLASRLRGFPLTAAHERALGKVSALAGACDVALYDGQCHGFGPYLDGAWTALRALGPVLFWQTVRPATNSITSVPSHGPLKLDHATAEVIQ
ncbi:hypothetical protein [Brytella acorum]|uniref:Uncharacterized protein n=1 Tax=Brytella acorum TaxID=2959299 RepID=A0AA35UHB9_9PROT|nr:hypothetical protein [Brytella acorum]MDF3625712.1 hypothetical protein [Brytella acorum]CAI9121341.1 hypothetical protein LMG32879_002188 [Brytella acorum]